MSYGYALCCVVWRVVVGVGVWCCVFEYVILRCILFLLYVVMLCCVVVYDVGICCVLQYYVVFCCELLWCGWLRYVLVCFIVR